VDHIGQLAQMISGPTIRVLLFTHTDLGAATMMNDPDVIQGWISTCMVHVVREEGDEEWPADRRGDRILGTLQLTGQTQQAAATPSRMPISIRGDVGRWTEFHAQATSTALSGVYCE